MKTIIAGSRQIVEEGILTYTLKKVPWVITEVVCGMARGVDTLGANWAIENDIPVAYFPADWKTRGKAAGPVRNREMAEYADALILIWDGKSRGSLNMLNTWSEIGGGGNMVSVTQEEWYATIRLQKGNGSS